MKISTIIPVYNVSQYITRCVESLVKQDYEDYEILLINDGSTDDSREICEYLEKKYQKVSLINQENQGSGFARNKGLSLATGDYIYFCDPDDYITGELFQAINRYGQQDSDMLVFGYYDEYERNGNVVRTVEKKVDTRVLYHQSEFRDHFASLYRKDLLYTLWNKAYSRRFLNDHRLLFTNAPMGQDVRFNLSVYRLIDTVKLIPENYYHYVIDRGDSSTNRYRENRVTLQLEENQQLQSLLQHFNRENPELIKEELNRIYMLNINRVVMSSATFEQKKQNIYKIMKNPAFNHIFEGNPYMHPISKFLLKHRWLSIYILMFNTIKMVKK